VQTSAGGPQPLAARLVSIGMRIACALLVATCLLASEANVAMASSRHRRAFACPASRSHVLVADRVAEVYEAPEPLGLHERIFACAHSGRHVYDLGPIPQCGGGAGGCESVEHVVLAGTIVAYERASATGSFQSRPGAEYQIVVRELRTGRTLENVPTGTNAVGGSGGSGPATAVVAKSDGAVAWIVQKSPVEGRYQVHVLDRAGARIVAVGPEIDPTALALAGSTLYWSQGGKAFSAAVN
jgi:hypothetical protein